METKWLLMSLHRCSLERQCLASSESALFIWVVVTETRFFAPCSKAFSLRSRMNTKRAIQGTSRRPSQFQQPQDALSNHSSDIAITSQRVVSLVEKAPNNTSIQNSISARSLAYGTFLSTTSRSAYGPARYLKLSVPVQSFQLAYLTTHTGLIVLSCVLIEKYLLRPLGPMRMPVAGADRIEW